MDDQAIYDHLSRFHSCGNCRTVFPSEDLAYIDLSKPSPCCGSYEPRGIWPEPAIALFVETARTQPLTAEGNRIQLVMLAAGAEAVMNQTVYAALEQRITDVVVAEALLDRYEGVKLLRDLFKKLTGKSVGGALGKEYATFLQTWDAIIKARNGIAHGQWNLKEVDRTRLLEFAAQLIPAAAALWNVAVRSGRPPPTNEGESGDGEAGP